MANKVHSAIEEAAHKKCYKCGGSGIYKWGAIINGVPQHTGTCYRCQGKGYQSKNDEHRNWGYDNFYSNMHGMPESQHE